MVTDADLNEAIKQSVAAGYDEGYKKGKAE